MNVGVNQMSFIASSGNIEKLLGLKQLVLLNFNKAHPLKWQQGIP